MGFLIRAMTTSLMVALAAATAASADPLGMVTEIPVGPGNMNFAGPQGITAGRDGNLWFTDGASQVGRITPAGTVSAFLISTNGDPHAITAGPDGNIWFTEPNGKRVGRVTPSGKVTEFSAGIPNDSEPFGIAAGPDGNLWFTNVLGDRIGRITPRGKVTEFSAGITEGGEPWGIATGPDGNLWFTERSGHRIGRITPAGAVTEFSTEPRLNDPTEITAGPDDNLWFTEEGASRIGRITPEGAITEFSTGITEHTRPIGIAAGPDGNLWFAQYAGEIGQITPTGTVTEFSAGITASSGPFGITAGPDGNLWFTEESGFRIARIGAGPVPTITKLAPKLGPVEGRTSVTITGTDFTNATAVKFGSLAATSFKVISANSLIALAPAESAGVTDATVTTSFGTSAISPKDHFKFTPTISSLSPGVGSIAGDTIVTVTGTGFVAGTTATVLKFGTLKGTSVNCTSTTECTVRAPAHAAGTVDVRATVNTVASPKTTNDRFSYG